MTRPVLCRLCQADVERGVVVEERPAHQLWRMLPSGEMQAIQVICDSEVERIVGMLTHPAKFAVDYASLVGVRPLEDGRYAVWWGGPYDADGVDEELVYDDAFDAATAFLHKRVVLKLGHDFETGLLP